MSLLQESLEGNFLNWVLVLASTLIIMSLDEFLLKFIFEHSWPLIWVQKQSINLSLLEFLNCFSGNFHDCFTKWVSSFWVEQGNHITWLTDLGGCYQYFLWNFLRVELLFSSSLLSFSRYRVSSCTHYLSIFTNDCFPPVVEFYQSFLSILIISIIRPSHKLNFLLKLCILSIFNLSAGIFLFDFGNSLLKTFFFSLSWSLRNLLLFNCFSCGNFANCWEDHIYDIGLQY